MLDLAILRTSKITVSSVAPLTPLPPWKKILPLVFYILVRFQKQAATPSAAAECIYRVKLHGLHANTIVWAAQSLLKDRLYLHIKGILQDMPIWGVHKEQSLLQLVPCLLKVLMYITDIKDIPQPYLVIYWELVLYKMSPDIQFLWLKGWKKNVQQNTSRRWNNLTPFSVFALKCPSNHQFSQRQKSNILSTFCGVAYWFFSPVL